MLVICALKMTIIETNTSNSKIISMELIADSHIHWDLELFRGYSLLLIR